MSLITQYKMESPYLEAIQKIPGKTPGEKYQTLNRIARKLIDDRMDIDDDVVKHVEIHSSAELPECLVPIVSLEVAKILHQPDGIVAALRSDDAFINDRALKVKWFFDGSNKDITNSQYFNEHIFPYVSLNVRIKIIKNLAKYLMLSNEQSIAENFYMELKEQYGEELIRPLCFACGEKFIENTTNKWNYPLSVTELEIIYPRFPNFVILLLTTYPAEYKVFLPNLLKHHADDFVSIVKSHNLKFKLSNKKSELFLKNARNALLDNPKLFIPLLSLKLITARLNKLEFYNFYKQLFPKNLQLFYFETLFEYLKYYPKEEKLNFLMSTFKEIYGINLLERSDLISLPLLLKNHADDFVNIIKGFHLDINFNEKKCELFLKNVRNVLIKNPMQFLPLMPLELLTIKLNKLEFHQFYKKLYPENHESFCFLTFYECLKYYPKEEKINLLMSTFEENYGISLLERSNVISLSLLLKNADDFVDIVKRLNLVNTFCEKKNELFTKNIRIAFLIDPTLLTTWKVITEKLNELEFHQFYKQLFPEDRKVFCFKTFYKYLEYYPEEEKLNLLMSTFENVYRISLLDCSYSLSPPLLQVLNSENRIKIARRKIERNDESRCIEYSWICCLPTNESIPLIKEKISKASAGDDRCKYLQELIYTCSINKDYNALLNVLEYIFLRHKNEQDPIIPNVLKRLRSEFDVKNLPKYHLIIVDQFVMFLHVKNMVKSCTILVSDLICDLIYSKLKYNEEIDKFIKLYIEFYDENIRNKSWNILKNYPDYERKFLVEFIRQICIDEERRYSVPFINNLLRSMYDFNERNAKATDPLEKLSIKNYPQLYEIVKCIITLDRDEYSDWEKNITDNLLKQNENDIFCSLVNLPKVPEKIEFHNSKIIKLLQKSPEKIMKNWEEYLELCKNKITKRNLARRFLRYAKWHQDLPIMFANECLKQLENKKNNDVNKNLYILAALYDGSSYEKLLTPFIPESKILDLSNSKTKDEYKLNCSILWSLNIVHPPVSFVRIFEFCQGDYVHKAVNTLNNIGRRVPVDKVKEFSKTLVNQKVSVKKHGIRLFCQVASYKQIQELMTYLWKKEKNLSIREVLYQFISKLFIDAPSTQSWNMLQTCIDEVKIEDYFWDNIFEFSDNVSDDFYECYILKLFSTIKRIEETENDFGRSKSKEYVTRIFNNSTHRSYLYSEEFHQYIIKNYYTDFSRPEYLLSYSIHNYIVNEYIAGAGDKLESRLVFLSDIITEMVKTSWNVPCPYETHFLTANYLIYKLTESICNMKCNSVKITTAKSVLDALLTVLKPEQLGTLYLDLIYIGVFDNNYSIDVITNKLVQLIPSLVEMYSSELMSTLVLHFKKPLNKFFINNKHIDVIYIFEKLLSINDKNINLFTNTLLLELSTSNGKKNHEIVIDKSKIKSEKLLQYIIKNHFTDSSRPDYLLSDRFFDYIIKEYIAMAGDKLESRLIFLSNIIIEMVKTTWNVLSAYEANFPIANRFVNKLIACICNMNCNCVKITTAKVIHDALMTFLKPQQLGTDYLDLVYSVVFDSEYSLDEITDKIVQLIPSLVEIYSNKYMETIVLHFKNALHKFLNENEHMGAIDIVEKLVLINNENINLFTRTLLFQYNAYYNNERHSIIIDQLKITSEEFHHFIIKSYSDDYSTPDYLLSERFMNYIIKVYIINAGDRLESRLIFLANVISKMVKKSWNVFSAHDTDLFIVNRFFDKLISCVCNIKECDQVKIQTAKVIHDALLTILKPEQLGTYYLDLVFICVFDIEYSIDEITNKLVQLIPSLVQIYSSKLMCIVADSFKKHSVMLLRNKKNIDVMDIVEKLVSYDDKNVLLFVSTLLMQSKFYNKTKQYPIIIDKLKMCKYPAIVIPMTDYLSSPRPNINYDDLPKIQSVLKRLN